jgi:hypothetical protein
MSRSKKTIAGFLPQKKWLSKAEAMAYMDLSVNEFTELVVRENLTVSKAKESGVKTYYKVSELDRVFENNVMIKQTA